MICGALARWRRSHLRRSSAGDPGKLESARRRLISLLGVAFGSPVCALAAAELLPGRLGHAFRCWRSSHRSLRHRGHLGVRARGRADRIVKLEVCVCARRPTGPAALVGRSAAAGERRRRPCSCCGSALGALMPFSSRCTRIAHRAPAGAAVAGCTRARRFPLLSASRGVESPALELRRRPRCRRSVLHRTARLCVCPCPKMPARCVRAPRNPHCARTHGHSTEISCRSSRVRLGRE